CDVSARVRLRSGASGAILLYGGDDTVTLHKITDPQTQLEVAHVDGGTGTDSISFAAFDQNLTITLTSAAVQDTTFGMFSLTGFENLTGGSLDDSLTGNDDANVL